MKPVIVLADRPFSVADIQTTEALDVRNVSRKSWGTLLAHCAAKELRLYHVLLASLDGIERVRTATSFEIVWANKITDLAPVFRMERLERLTVSDLPQLRSLEGIEALGNLTEVDISGNCGSLSPPLRLASLKPLAKLAKLTKLLIFNVRLEDEEISFIGSAFPHLRSLDVWNHNVDRAQLAWIAGKLNPQLEQPISAHRKLSVPCKKCGGSLYRFVGYRMPIVCERCDETRFRKLVAEFELLKTSVKHMPGAQ